MQARPGSIHRFASDDSGQDLIEYALLGAFIGLAAVASLQGVANAISTVFQTIPAKAEAAMYS